MQTSFALNFDDVTYTNAPLEGYKGLAGFHKYWGKKPTEAWRLLIERITNKGDIVLDPFLGSGLLAKECIDRERKFIGCDLNPISIELTNLYLAPPSNLALKKAILNMEKSLRNEINNLYRLSNGVAATHLLWQEGRVARVWRKKGGRLIEVELSKSEVALLQNIAPYKPTHLRPLRLFDNSRINSKKDFSIEDLFTPRALRAIDGLKNEINQYEGKTKRALRLILSSALGQMSKMVFAVSKRGKTKGKESERIEVGSWVIGYWRPAQHFEINAWNCFKNKAGKLMKAIGELPLRSDPLLANDVNSVANGPSDAYVRVADAEKFLKDIPSNSVKAILTDPPHGDRIPYLELSEMWNSVLELHSEYSEELVVSNAKGRNKDIKSYNAKLSSIFSECDRVLENNGVLAIMYNARSGSHWESLNQLEASSGLTYLGCYPMNYSAGSVVQDNRKGGLKTDFVLVYGKANCLDQMTSVSSALSAVQGWSDEYPRKA